jgi:hypothetical protein
MARREVRLPVGSGIKNMLSFLAYQPFAARLAKHHFESAIQVADRIDGMGIKGQACLALGRLYQTKKKYALAQPRVKQSIAIFESLGAEEHLRRAQAVMAEL